VSAFLVPVLVAIATAAITRLSIPTLNQRLRRHAALLKDLPAGSAGAVRIGELVDREAAALADRDGRFFDRWLANPKAVKTVLSNFTPTLVALAAAATVAIPTENLSPDAPAGLIVAGLAAAASLSALVSWGVSRRG